MKLDNNFEKEKIEAEVIRQIDFLVKRHQKKMKKAKRFGKVYQEPSEKIML
jgi:hypothetical protein